MCVMNDIKASDEKLCRVYLMLVIFILAQDAKGVKIIIAHPITLVHAAF